MEFRQLKHFLAVVEAGNFRQAAKRVFLSPPALSMSLRNLEASLDVTLLKREKKGVVLTPAGEQLLPVAQAILNQVSDVKASLNDCQESLVGNVRLGLPVGLINALAAPLLKLLNEHYPGINLIVEEGNTTTLERSFQNGLLDLMMSYDLEDRLDRQIEPLYTEQLYFVGPYSDEDANAGDIPLKDLENYTIISSSGSHSMRRTLDRYAFDNNIEFKFVMDFQSAHSSLKLAVEGVGHTIAAWDLIHDHVRSKLVSARRIIMPTVNRTVCLISTKNPINANIVTALRAVIRMAIQQAISENKIKKS